MISHSAPHRPQRQPYILWRYPAVLMPVVGPQARQTQTQLGYFFPMTPNSALVANWVGPPPPETKFTADILPRLKISYRTPRKAAKRSPQGSAMTREDLLAWEVCGS
jgi:hypothetical protein